MSFFKSLLLAIIATVFLTYVLGASVFELLDLDIYIEDSLVEPMQALSISALVMLFLVLAAIAIVLSVFGTVIFLVMMVVGAAAMMTIGVFWPIFVVAFLIWWMTKEQRQTQ